MRLRPESCTAASWTAAGKGTDALRLGRRVDVLTFGLALTGEFDGLDGEDSVNNRNC